jgi:hypothetical protein
LNSSRFRGHGAVAHPMTIKQNRPIGLDSVHNVKMTSTGGKN